MTNAPAATDASAASQNTAGTAIWIALIAGLTVIGSYGYACAAPLAAVAALAALKMERTDGLILVGLAWVINQAVGFLLLSYPHTTESYLWGAAIGFAAFVGYFAARAATRANVPAIAGWVITFLVAFAGYQAALYVGGWTFTDPSSGFTAEVVGEVFAINAVAYAGFALVYLAAVALSVIAPTRRAKPQAAPSEAVSA